MTFCLDLEIGILEAIEYQHNDVQHPVNGAAKDTDIIEVEQEHKVLVIPKTHLHEMTKTSTSIGESKRHISNNRLV